MAKPYKVGERAATAIAQICCHKKRLPQGAPTSPVISNMMCAKLDGDLKRLAAMHRCKYSRYADDLTFSTIKPTFPSDLAVPLEEGTGARIGPVLHKAIASNGFDVNPEKVRLQSRSHRQVVTGLTVNKRPNVPRAFVSQIRAMLHAWQKHGYEAAQSEFLAKYDQKHRPKQVSARVFERVVRGKLEFLRQVRGEDDNRYRRLRKRFGVLIGEVAATAQRGEIMDYDVFICHASEDKAAVVDPLGKALGNADIRVWLDASQIGWGDSIITLINDGLSRSRFVILVLSASFIKKNWPVKEMAAVLSKEITSGVTCALPLLVGDAAVKEQILSKYPLLADKHYLEWSKSDLGSIVSTLKARLQRVN